ncbi:hypothetical protein Hanom_Chr07g00628331 [Helianthus anomalus]
MVCWTLNWRPGTMLSSRSEVTAKIGCLQSRRSETPKFCAAARNYGFAETGFAVWCLQHVLLEAGAADWVCRA